MKNINYNFIGIATGLLLSSTGVHAAYNDAGTEYTTETVETWIDMGASMEPLNFFRLPGLSDEENSGRPNRQRHL